MRKSLGILLAIGLFLTGCTSKEVTYDPKNFNDYFLIGRDYQTLNQLTSMSAADLKIIANIADGMTETDSYGNKIGALAESWEHNDDFTVWTFKLKEATWSNQQGEVIAPVTAQDFVYAASYVLDPEMASSNAEYLFLFEGAKDYYEAKLNGQNPSFDMVGVKALDEKTVQYTMASGCPYLLSVLSCNGFYPICESFVKSLDNPASYGSLPEKTAYNGAFIIENHILDNELVMVKNENYWDKDKVNFDTITFKAVKDEESVFELFNRGEVSVAPLVSTQVITQFKKENPYLIQKDTEMMTYGIFFNNQTLYSEDVNKALSNEAFRQSIFYGFDRLALTELINPVNPKSIVNGTFCPTNFVKTSEGVDYTALEGLKQFSESDLFQLDKALTFKQQAQNELSKEGVTFPICLKIWSKSGDVSQAERMAMVKDILESNLGEDYINVELYEYTSSFREEALAKGDYAIHISGWNPDYADPINCLTVMKSDGTLNNFEKSTSQGSSHFKLEAFDRLVEEADQIVDLDERYKAFAKAETYLLEHAYYVPLYISGGTYELTTLNEFTRMHSQVGIDHFKYKGMQAFETPVTTSQYEALQKEWEKGQ